MMTMPLAFQTTADVVRIRNRLGLTQTQFWKTLGVSQSAGSRYETGAAIPEATRMLLTIVYGSEEQSANLVAALRATVAEA